MKKNTKNFWNRHWHWIGLLVVVLVGSGIVAQNISYFNWLESVNNECDISILDEFGLPAVSTRCKHLEPDGVIDPQYLDELDQTLLSVPNINTGGDSLPAKVINHTGGGVKETVGVCPVQGSTCVVGSTYYETISGFNLSSPYWLPFLTQGFGGASSIPSDGKTHQLTTGPNVGTWVHLAQNSSNGYLYKNAYNEKPRHVFVPYANANEFIKTFQATESGSDTVLELETTTGIAGSCTGTANPVCSGGSACTAFEWDGSMQPSAFAATCSAQGVGCSYSAPTCADNVLQSSCSAVAGCTWQPKLVKTGVEICHTSTDLDLINTTPGAKYGTIEVSNSSTPTGWQCSGGEYGVPQPDVCVGTYNFDAFSCDGGSYEVSTASCTGTMVNIPTFDPPFIQAGMACGEVARDQATCNLVSHLSCSWNPAANSGEGECGGVFDASLIGQLTAQNETIVNEAPFFGSPEAYWLNPMQNWLPGASCAVAIGDDMATCGIARDFGCNVGNGTTCAGTFNKPMSRTDVPHNGEACRVFNDDKNACSELSLNGCTWNDSVSNNCAAYDNNSTTCLSQPDDVDGNTVCVAGTQPKLASCNNFTTNATCNGVFDDECDWITPYEMVSCDTDAASLFECTGGQQATPQFFACSWGPVYAAEDAVDVPGCYSWAVSDWGSCLGDHDNNDNGLKTRTVSCVDSDNNVVSDNKCVGSTKPLAAEQCANWIASSFGSCIDSLCTPSFSQSGVTYDPLQSDNCSQKTTQSSCVVPTGPSGFGMSACNWTEIELTSALDDGVKTRIVQCAFSGIPLADSECNPDTRPVEKEYCPSPITNSSGAPNQGCFIAGTKVLLADGTEKNIENVTMDDQLLDSNGVANDIFKRYVIDYKGLLFSINGGGYFVSDSHPFMTLEGWKSMDPEKTRLESPGLAVSQLQIGDVLIKKGDTELIETIDSKYDEITVYNFGLNGSKEYYADGYLVHNVDFGIIGTAEAAAIVVKSIPSCSGGLIYFGPAANACSAATVINGAMGCAQEGCALVSDVACFNEQGDGCNGSVSDSNAWEDNDYYTYACRRSCTNISNSYSTTEQTCVVNSTESGGSCTWND